MKKITIGFFNDSFPPMTDGVGMVIDNYARRLCEIANVIVFVPDYKEDYDDSIYPYTVVRCKSVKMPFIDYSLPLPLVDSAFRKEVAKYQFDIIHIHSPFTIGKFGLNYAKRHHIPVLGTMHSQYEQDVQRAVSSRKVAHELTQEIASVYNRCDQCYAVSQGMAELYFKHYGIKKMPLVLPNATEMKYLSHKDKAIERINKLHHLKKNDKVFLFVGRINKLKNIFFIIDSLVLLNKKKLNYSYKMLFVGQGQDEADLKKYIHKKHLDDFVIICGNVEDRNLLRDYYVRSDLFLFPSLYDTSSLVQKEAASQKVPTVYLKGSMTSSDVHDHEDGFLVENEQEFADAIDEAMTDKELYQKVSEGAYQNVYRNWDDVVKMVYQIYLEVIHRR